MLVEDESALRIAVDAADGSAIIALTSDIILTDSALGIPYGKDITLVSDKPEGFWKLIGVADQNTIDVKGKLTIDGIIVTHRKGFGCGVCVNGGGTFFMYSGEISDNKGVKGDGYGGVYNMGTFVMSGGIISNNTADVDGGGVYNIGGSFVMSGGKISKNAVLYVTESGSKDDIKGDINAGAGVGGGVSLDYGGIFDLRGGVIFGNTASNGGGDVHKHGGNLYYFGVRDVVFICMCVALVVVVTAVGVVVLLLIKRKN
ncbi:MAG: hypothetical protein LBC03_05120 [Nitrososphaerota archaeon]|nr:hypothetical protein [Nitrososphaerota archaeon]